MKRGRGFTLIELLVVISIIGLLSSVVLSSLTSARNRAKDARLMQEARQIATLHNLEFAERNSYSNLNRGGWRNTTGTPTGYRICADASYPFANPASNFAAQANTLCESIVNVVGTAATGALYNGINGYFWDSARVWSVMVYLPGQNKYFCIGSSGRTSISAYTAGTLVIPPGTEGSRYPAGGSFTANPDGTPVSGTGGLPVGWISPGCYSNP